MEGQLGAFVLPEPLSCLCRWNSNGSYSRWENYSEMLKSMWWDVFAENNSNS